MPRIAGQIDQAKTEAILNAAAQAMAECGFAASMGEIARRAGVSKQTIYNHYGSKAELVRAIVEQRVGEITAPLTAPDAHDHPEEALAGFGRVMIEMLVKPKGNSLLRMTVKVADDMPDLATAFYEAGPRTSRRLLSEFLRAETEAGRMAVDDSDLAAEFFAGMVIGGHQVAGLLGQGRDLPAAEIDRTAREAARRFMRAYAVA